MIDPVQIERLRLISACSAPTVCAPFLLVGFLPFLAAAGWFTPVCPLFRPTPYLSPPSHTVPHRSPTLYIRKT